MHKRYLAAMSIACSVVTGTVPAWDTPREREEREERPERPFDPASAALGAGIAAAAATVVGGICYYCNWSTAAEERKVQEAECTLSEAAHDLTAITRVLPVLITDYQEMVRYYNGRGACDFADLKEHVREVSKKLARIKKELQSVASQYRKSKEHGRLYHRALELLSRCAELMHQHESCQDVIDTVIRCWEKPLEQLPELQAFVCRLEAQRDDLLSFLRREYAAKETADGIKNHPLICAAEDIASYQKKIRALRTQLLEHNKFVQDVQVKTVLADVAALAARLKEIQRTITSSTRFKDEVRAHDIRKEALLQAKADYEKAEADRLRAERARLAEKNREREIEARAQQAKADMLHAVAAVADVTLYALTGHTCNDHRCDFYHCPRGCPHRKEYCRVHVYVS